MIGISFNLAHVEIGRVIVFDRWNHGLHKFQENNQIHMDLEAATAVYDHLDEVFHGLGVPAGVNRCLRIKMTLEFHCVGEHHGFQLVQSDKIKSWRELSVWNFYPELT